MHLRQPGFQRGGHRHVRAHVVGGNVLVSEGVRRRARKMLNVIVDAGIAQRLRGRKVEFDPEVRRDILGASRIRKDGGGDRLQLDSDDVGPEYVGCVVLSDGSPGRIGQWRHAERDRRDVCGVMIDRRADRRRGVSRQPGLRVCAGDIIYLDRKSL